MSVLNSLPSDASSSDEPPSSSEEEPGGEGFEIGFATLSEPLLLKPDKVPRKWLPGAVIFCLYIVSAISAPVVWSMIARKNGDETAQVKSRPASNAAATSVPLLTDEGGFARTKEPPRRGNTSPPSPQSVLIETTASLTADDGSAEAKGPPVKALAQPVPAHPRLNSSQTVGSALVLDNDEIASLLKRGRAFLTNGDLASARLLLSRAAEAGSAEAAAELGATFDPLVLKQRGVIGVEPDIARARKWYQRAAELGSTVATEQLAKLNGVR
jgi:TPR repeat protein